MKKTIIFFCLIPTLLAGCKKFLNTTPESFLASDQYYTGNNLTNALAGVYNTLYQSYLYGEYYWGNQQACTDESFYGGSGRTLTTGTPVYNFDYGDAVVNGYWSALYTGIERANQFIAHIDTNDSSSAVQAAYGEVLFLRGYFYYMLVTFYGGVPLRLTPTTSVDNLSLVRSSVEDVYKQIVADMTAAESKVYNATDLNYSSRVSKTTIEGILARVCLSMAGYPLQDKSQYANALTWAQKVVASGIHSLNPSYKQVFINEASDVYDIKEAMWEADFSGNYTTSQPTTGWVGSYGGIPFGFSNTYSNVSGATDYIYADTGYAYGFIWATKKLYNLYDIYDARRNWNLGSYTYAINSSYGSSVVYRTPLTGAFAYNRPDAKWRRNYEVVYPKSKNFTPENFPILRYSDVLLMLAEAEFNLNGSTSLALNAINAVRERGYGWSITSAPAKKITLLTPGSGYKATFSLGDDNFGSGIAYTATVSSGKITVLSLDYGGSGFKNGDVITIGATWYPKYYYAANSQIVYNGNLYTASSAGVTSSTPPTNTSGSSAAATTGIAFTYAGVAATASITPITQADVDLTTLTLQNIQDERSRELCFEALRVPDLVRWGIFIPSMKAIATDMSSSTFSINNKTQASLGYNNISDRNVLLPIPSSEISVNTLVTQNPGW